MSQQPTQSQNVRGRIRQLTAPHLGPDVTEDGYDPEKQISALDCETIYGMVRNGSLHYKTAVGQWRRLCDKGEITEGLLRNLETYADPQWRGHNRTRRKAGPDKRVLMRDRLERALCNWTVTSRRAVRPGDPEQPPEDYCPDDGPVRKYRTYVRMDLSEERMVRIISVMEEACPYYLGELRTRHSSEAPDMPFPEWLSDHLTEIREDMTRGKLAITGGS